MTTELLECDGCRARRQGNPGATLDQLRDALSTVGWKSDKANNIDACPACLSSGRIESRRA